MMNAAIVGLFCLAALFLGFRFFGNYLDVKIFKSNAKAPVPSHEFKDNIDYVPTNKFVLFGHHFASVAGAAPIIGPALAVIWGRVPALLWVLLGTIMWGATHDFGALVLSVRNKGKSIGELAKDIIGSKATTLYDHNMLRCRPLVSRLLSCHSRNTNQLSLYCLSRICSYGHGYAHRHTHLSNTHRIKTC